MRQIGKEKNMTTYVLNQRLNGIEISFDSKPEKGILDSLKTNGFRWNPKKSIWYAKQNESTLNFAKGICGNAGTETKVEAKTGTETKVIPVNAYGVKIGDLFYDTYGYDATLYDFYEVVALRGTKQVVLRPVAEERKQTDFCSAEVKPIKGKYLTGHGYKTRLLSGSDETLVRTIMQKGNYVTAGKLYPASWDRTFSESNYH